MQIYYVQPLQHAEGMLMAYLPKEKLVIAGLAARKAYRPTPGQPALHMPGTSNARDAA